MKQIKKEQIAEWKKWPFKVPKIDYSMNTKYYRAVSIKGEWLGASVEPLRAAAYMVGQRHSILIEVQL